MIRRHMRCRRTVHTLHTPRARDSTDVLIIGGGPAGLCAAIRLKQLTPTLRVVVLEKGSELGSHILSGCVLDPSSFYRLLGHDVSTYEDKYGCGKPPLGVQARGQGEMVWLTDGGRTVGIPHPPQMGNRGNWVLDSLSGLVRWLGRVAEEVYGVEVYAGFGGARVVYGEEEEESPWVEWGGRWGKEVTGVKDRVEEKGKVPRVVGVLTNDVGISKKGEKREGLFTPGMFFQSKLTLFAEGAHGSLSKSVIQKFNLRAESDPQTYGIGIKEVWRTSSSVPGSITHTLGFPLDLHTYGGGWVYHLQQNLLSIGLVVGLDYANPTRSPYRDFQKLKHHPYFRSLLSDATRVAYGARVLTEGGLQSLPLLHFPGGALIGDSAGTVNVAKIKGVHNAMGTGMLAAEAIAQVSSSSSSSPSLSSYTSSFLTSPIFSELYSIRNLRPSFDQPNLFPFSLLSQTAPVLGGIIYSGIDSLLFKGRVPFTLSHAHSPDERARCRNSAPSLDSVRTQPTSTNSNSVPPIDYPAYEPPLSTDLLTSLALTNTFHEEDQPEHLRLLTLEEATREDSGRGVLGVGLGRLRFEDEEEEAVSAPEENAEKNDGERELGRRRAHTKLNVSEYASLLERACPAGVYEYVDDPLSSQSGDGWGGKKLVINAQNCIHCKLCDIKVPSQDITWTVPEGGGGPGYTIT
ncbi:hypothetical protein C8R42DRAFT_645265 [Lentinula raphanica]|nr:hypothetical protein C8R42DRAFT_645265 [Lentinula raphanica]